MRDRSVSRVISALLILISVLGALHATAQEEKPRVRILAPVDGAAIEQSEVIFLLAVPQNGAARPLRVLIDAQLTAARELSVERGAAFSETGPRAAALAPSEELRRVQVSIPARNCAVSFSLGADAPASIIYLKWAGAQKEYRILPALYVLAVGVGAYTDPLQPLKYPAKDARDLAAAFLVQKGVFYRDVVIKLIVDEEASRDGILNGLEWIKKETTQNDVAVVLLAGHGINEPRNGDYYFVPHKGNIALPESSLIAGAQIVNSLSGMAGKVLVFLDTCHAGNVMSPYRARGNTDVSSFVSELLNAGGALIIFAAATGRQTSKENDAWQNGAFTKAVVEGIRGSAARDASGRITINMLDDYVTNKVKELTQGNQTPATAKPQAVPDFPIAVVPPKQTGVPKNRVPVYKKWWFWTIVGGTVAAAAAIGLGVGLSNGISCNPRFAICRATQ